MNLRILILLITISASSFVYSAATTTKPKATTTKPKTTTKPTTTTSKPTTTKPKATTTKPKTTTKPTTTTGQFNCGVPAIQPDTAGLRIVGGRVAIPNSWPWQVWLSGAGLCGGSIINNRWILTAAHCEMPVSGFRVFVGEHNIRVRDGEISMVPNRWISHPSYNSRKFVNDIALIRLSTNITYTSRVSPVCLPGGVRPTAGRIGIVTGWGGTKADGNGEISEVLKQATIPILPSSEASSLYGTLLSTQIYAGVISATAPQDSCRGDSGGPFVLRNPVNGVFTQVGVVSYGHECGGNGVYTNVVDYESWIQNTIRANP